MQSCLMTSECTFFRYRLWTVDNTETVDLYHVKHQTWATTITHKSYAQWSCLVSSSQSQKNCFHAWKLTVSDSIKRIASMLLLPILYALRWKFILIWIDLYYNKRRTDEIFGWQLFLKWLNICVLIKNSNKIDFLNKYF